MTWNKISAARQILTPDWIRKFNQCLKPFPEDFTDWSGADWKRFADLMELTSMAAKKVRKHWPR